MTLCMRSLVRRLWSPVDEWFAARLVILPVLSIRPLFIPYG